MLNKTQPSTFLTDSW